MGTSDSDVRAAGISGPAATRRRWRIAVLLGFGVLITYFDRVNLSVAHDALRHDFAINDFTYGLLLGAYNWTYAALQMPVGAIIDRFGVRLVGRVAAFLWSLATFGGALAPGINSLFGARFLLGVGEAPTFPASAKAVGAWFPPNERGFSTSLFDAAAKFSSAIGIPIFGLILLRFGWRITFLATGILSVGYLIAFFIFYREPQDDPHVNAQEMALIQERDVDTRCDDDVEIPLWTLIRQPKVLGLSIGFGSYNYVFYLLLTWLPTYFSESLHIDLLHSFLYTGVPWLSATGGDLFGGLLADRLIQRGWHGSRTRMTILVVGTAFGLGILGTAWSHTAAQAVLWITISITGLSVAAPIGWSIPSLIAPPRSVGRVGGIMNLSNQISGISAPIVTGFIVYDMHSFPTAFAVAGVYLVLGICAYLFLLREVKMMRVPRATD